MAETNEELERLEAVDVTLLYDVWRATRVVSGVLDEVVGPSGLSADDFALYSLLLGAGSLSPTSIARYTGTPATTVSSYLRRLERLGHVKRSPNPADGRSSLISLTVSGKRAHERAAKLFGPVSDAFEARMGSGVGTAKRALARIRATLLEVVE